MIISESDRQQLLNLFAAEAEETLANLEDLLLQLEKAPHQADLLHEIFRGAHTLKGSASCLQFNELTTFAHAVEGTLDRLRNHEIDVTPERISQLLTAVDALRDLSLRSVAGQCAMRENE
ncbi:MAG TPA: Hpt domain-containing protein, partial [Thermoanaerobaculia bacterium]